MAHATHPQPAVRRAEGCYAMQNTSHLALSLALDVSNAFPRLSNPQHPRAMSTSCNSGVATIGTCKATKTATEACGSRTGRGRFRLRQTTEPAPRLAVRRHDGYVPEVFPSPEQI